MTIRIKKAVITDPALASRVGTDKESVKTSFLNHLIFSLSRDVYTATPHDYYTAIALSVRDRLVEKWIRTQGHYYSEDPRRVYYLSLEFLIGRTLGNSIINLQIHQPVEQALEELGVDLDELREVEVDAGLGNGGLGRLAACFLDSLASLGYPAHGYGIRYEYGIFTQKIENGYQVETADKWLQLGNAWELGRPEVAFTVKFGGRVEGIPQADGTTRFKWVDAHEVHASPYDIPIPGYGNKTVNTLRLWAAKATTDFDLNFFNSGDYVAAVEHKNQDENISRVLYPNDNFAKGKELRLKQQYFFVSATLQDILRRYRLTPNNESISNHKDLRHLPEKAVIQLNDTHPVIAIPETMRLLLDEEGLGWEAAWDITSRLFCYTNHTVLPEALEKWSVGLMEYILPRHVQIIREINRRFLAEVEKKYPGDHARAEKMAIITGGHDPVIRMANLAIVACQKVNGVAALHTEILKDRVFPEFHEFYPGKFVNVTNGITHRRWLRKCNPGLSELITKKIGGDWIHDLTKLKGLEPLAEDLLFRERFRLVKRENKVRLAEYIRQANGIDISLDSMFDAQVKRFHEYKRQLLNLLSVIALYNRIRENPTLDVVPRTVIFSGKSAPGYHMAKLIIKLINSVADVVNNDPAIGSKLKVVFLANYSVSLAEKIIPAADLSQQVSTAGMEASGTGNMKFALNGALTIGTLDGANVEIKEEVGDDNIFIFGLTAEEVSELRRKGYSAQEYYEKNSELKKVIDLISGNHFSKESPGLFQPIVDSLLRNNDYYLLFADFASYMEMQDKVSETYKHPEIWYKKAILNVARMGKFSSDRSIQEYAENIWKIKPSFCDH